ncbi:MAG: DUF2513 domain-containing protein [Glycocaulis sp.]
MKRDMDLVRLILIEIEGADTVRTGVTKLAAKLGVEKSAVEHHLTLMEEAGYVQQHISRPLPTGAGIHAGWRLTWAGYEFLESIRDPEIWRNTKAAAKDVGSFAVSLLAQIAKAIVLAKAKELGFITS